MTRKHCNSTRRSSLKGKHAFHKFLVLAENVSVKIKIGRLPSMEEGKRKDLKKIHTYLEENVN